MVENKVLKERHFKAGYVLKTEEVDDGNGGTMIMQNAYTPSGDYIGNKRDAWRLVAERGIAPEKITSESNVCSIGFSAKQNKWFGWSHRAIHGFGIGDKVKKGDLTASSGCIKGLEGTPGCDTALPVGFEANRWKMQRKWQSHSREVYRSERLAIVKEICKRLHVKEE